MIAINDLVKSFKRFNDQRYYEVGENKHSTIGQRGFSLVYCDDENLFCDKHHGISKEQA